MPNSVSQKIQDAAKLLLQDVRKPGASTAKYLNSTLNQFLAKPFKAGSMSIIDAEGKTASYETAIYQDSDLQTNTQSTEVKVDTVACGVHVAKNLNSEELQTGYEHIATFKRLKRTQRTEANPSINSTPLGIIFALDSNVPLDKIAEHVISLNKSFPSYEWPDMVVILTRGTINYVVQIHGEPIKGDFLLFPNRTGFPIMPMYIHLFARNLELFSLNKMCHLLFMHLKTFSLNDKLSNIDEVLKDAPPSGITLGAYQYNLKYQLVPVPNEIYLKKGKPISRPLRIEDSKGNLLSHLQFIPWQDGGAVRLFGKLPLDGILPFFGSVAANAPIIRQSDGAISTVLPIQENQFKEMMERFQSQSNMNVKAEKPKFVFQKVSDEGTTSPFIARLHLGILNLRNFIFPDNEKRNKFDDFYQVVLDTLTNVRETSKEIIQTLAEHSRKVSQGEIVRSGEHAIHINKSIDKDLRKEVEGFLNGSIRVFKDGMQILLKFLKLDIGFLYQKENAFNNGIAKLTKTHPELATYLRETRKWSERLISVRNSLHKGWMLPKMEYPETYGGFQAVEPQISGQSVSEFVDFMSDRLCCFVEEVTAYALQTQLPPKMPPNISITEIPISGRRADCCERFKFTLITREIPIWSISYHDSKFDET